MDTNYLDASSNKFSLEVLKGKNVEGVDPARKEAYLEDSVFEATFGMNIDKFNDLKKWKQKELKVAKGIF